MISLILTYGVLALAGLAIGTKRKTYGTRECPCGEPFEAIAPNHKYCTTCRTVVSAWSVRNEAAKCHGCDGSFYRRDGHDYYCPTCHALGGGDKRWHPGKPLEAPCAVCEQRDRRIDDHLPLCATCLANPELEVKKAVNKVLLPYRARAGVVNGDEPAPQENMNAAPRRSVAGWADLSEAQQDRVTELLLASSASHTVTTAYRDAGRPPGGSTPWVYERYAASWKDGDERPLSEWLEAEFTQVSA